MNDMSSVIIPKSDQINADDLIAGPRTVRIRDVQIRGGQEQPVSIFYDEDNGKPFRPCKSMSRVLVAMWGPDAQQYIGRSLTLYRDPNVKWAGMAVGGIRISHMSHIERETTTALTETKGSRKPFTVRPLKVQEATQKAAPDDATMDRLRAGANDAARLGTDALRQYVEGLSREDRAAIKPEIDDYKAIAKKSDERPETNAARPPTRNPDPDEGYPAWGRNMTLDLASCDAAAELALLDDRYRQHIKGYEIAMPEKAKALAELMEQRKGDILNPRAAE